MLCRNQTALGIQLPDLFSITIDNQGATKCISLVATITFGKTNQLVESKGAADRWVTNFKAKDEAKFAELTFDNDLDNSLISAFKKKFVTNYWKEVYLKQYEEYRQSLNEISLEYLETKCYLLQKANLSKEEKPVKQQIRDILNGLVPQVYQFCDHAIKDPYRKDIKESPKTIDGLETIFAWAEECLYTIYNTISYKSDHVASVAQPQVVRSTQPVYTVVRGMIQT
ncbi:hypothetical protein BD560DRAFT_442042 [Blakeslea trispora]|nr:hypothetical protein BD560DRAFT_442042 [Blakeslea trispora]